jgi:flagellar basal body-associated protein FliL
MAKNEEKNEKEQPKTKSSLVWIIGLIVVTCSAGFGFGLGKLLANAKNTEPPKEEVSRPEEPEKKPNTWYYDLEPIVANLDEPGALRYIRTALTLEMSWDIPQSKGKEFLAEKEPIMKDWLSVYLAGLSLRDVQGDKNQRIIQSEIRESLNEELFPDEKPKIKQVLFKEFAIQ